MRTICRLKGAKGAAVAGASSVDEPRTLEASVTDRREQESKEFEGSKGSAS